MQIANAYTRYGKLLYIITLLYWKENLLRYNTDHYEGKLVLRKISQTGNPYNWDFIS